MKIRLFQACDGDCLLLEARSGHRMLCDGGSPSAMRDVIAPVLARHARDGEALDLVYGSHPGEGQVGGVLVLLEAALQWRVHDYHVARGDPPARPPMAPPVPRIGAVWHNPLHDLLARDAGALYGLLADGARAMRSSRVPQLEALGREFATIANALPQGMRLARLLQRDLLDIPRNVPLDVPAGMAPQRHRDASTPMRDAALMLAGTGAPGHRLGSLRLRVLSPTEDDLSRLRSRWNHWLRDPGNRIRADALRERYAANVLAMADGRAGNPFDLRDWDGTSSYRGFSMPDIASLVVHVEEDGHTALLGGDAPPDMVLAGLEQAGLLTDGAAHVDVLKVPRGGAQRSMTPAFGRAVSADHYLFCGNGADGHPEVSVLDAFVASRLERTTRRGPRPFTFWFTTTSAAQMQQANIAQMERVERWAETALRRHGQWLRVRFVERDHATLTLR